MKRHGRARARSREVRLINPERWTRQRDLDELRRRLMVLNDPAIVGPDHVPRKLPTELSFFEFSPL
jgi:hypothetical protein